MKHLAATAIATLSPLLVALAPASAADGASTGAETTLERFPVCEASAAIEMPCRADATKTCVWVADNEQGANLFEYDIGATGVLSPATPFAIEIGDAKKDARKYGDIEALARDGDAVLAIGSHGRNRGCEAKKVRARVARIAGSPPTATRVAGDEGWKKSLAHCSAALIALGDDGAEGPAARLREQACDVIAEQEARAEAYATEHPDEKDCPATPFNVEGAVHVADGGRTRVWVGLRAPLLASGKALLLRIVLPEKPDEHLTFDGIAAIDLQGQAIRELTQSDGTLWGIAGSVRDDPRSKSRLWRAPLSALTNGATIADVTFVHDQLPPTAEGLVVQPAEKRAIVLMDGDLDQSETACATPSTQMTIALP